VTLENLQFSPRELTVHRGDRIVWVNKDLFPHTATADGHAFDSGSIPPNGSWTYVARKPGEYSYGCTFHPTMKATLTVQ
jgi:plastocyanin